MSPRIQMMSMTVGQRLPEVSFDTKMTQRRKVRYSRKKPHERLQHSGKEWDPSGEAKHTISKGWKTTLGWSRVSQTSEPR